MFKFKAPYEMNENASVAGCFQFQLRDAVFLARARCGSTAVKLHDNSSVAGGRAAMRRRLRRVIPIFAVALLVQLLAPIGAFRFVATAIADPAAVAPRCAAMAAQQDNPSDSLPSQDGSCCAICAVGLGSAPVPAAQPQDFVVARPYQTVVWNPADQPALRGHRAIHAQARGPPAARPA
jgi:hypothetical protein